MNFLPARTIPMKLVESSNLVGFGFGACSFGLRASGLESGVWSLGFRTSVQGFGFMLWGLGLGVWGLGFGVWGLRFGVSCFGFRVQGLVAILYYLVF